MKFTIAAALTFLILLAILLLITLNTDANASWWTWTQIVLASLIVWYIYSLKETK